MMFPMGRSVGRSAASKKAWQSRRRGVSVAGRSGLKAAAKAAGAVVSRRPISMAMTKQAWQFQSAKTRQAAKTNAYIRTHRAANINALRIAKGRPALVFKNQMSPSSFAVKQRAVRARVRYGAMRDLGMKRTRGGWE